jgi:hypothetical protein
VKNLSILVLKCLIVYEVAILRSPLPLKFIPFPKMITYSSRMPKSILRVFTSVLPGATFSDKREDTFSTPAFADSKPLLGRLSGGLDGSKTTRLPPPQPLYGWSGLPPALPIGGWTLISQSTRAFSPAIFSPIVNSFFLRISTLSSILLYSFPLCFMGTFRPPSSYSKISNNCLQLHIQRSYISAHLLSFST